MLKLNSTNRCCDTKRLTGTMTDSTAGFTMVEVIVSLGILGVSLVAIFGAMQISARASHHSRMLSRSVLLAESLLAETRIRMLPKPVYETRSGNNGSYSWEVRVTRTTVEQLGAVRVQVNWQEQQREQEYELLSLVNMKPTLTGI